MLDLMYTGEGVLYHVTYPMMHMMYLPPPPEQNDIQMPVKILPSRNFVCGRK